MGSPSNHPHRRFNALTGDWVLVSPHRTQRPWQGHIEKVVEEIRPRYDPDCYLCPGNLRAGGHVNPDYSSTYVFTNDYPALLPEIFPEIHQPDGLTCSQALRGTCQVICYSPYHDLSMALMSVAQIRCVIDLWADQTAELSESYHWVQIFENKGAMMGSSNPHPHGQIWAQDRLPNEPSKEDQQQRKYYSEHQRSLLGDYQRQERSKGERKVLENAHWLVIVPYWSVWPFETLLISTRQVQHLTELNDDERDSLAMILKALLVRYDNLFETSFPYSMGWHGAPFTDDEISHWQLHAHFYPPLLRSATIKKFLVGYEMLSEAQRDITPEQAAARLREVSAVHYVEVRNS